MQRNLGRGRGKRRPRVRLRSELRRPQPPNGIHVAPELKPSGPVQQACKPCDLTAMKSLFEAERTATHARGSNGGTDECKGRPTKATFVSSMRETAAAGAQEEAVRTISGKNCCIHAQCQQHARRSDGERDPGQSTLRKEHTRRVGRAAAAEANTAAWKRTIRSRARPAFSKGGKYIYIYILLQPFIGAFKYRKYGNGLMQHEA